MSSVFNIIPIFRTHKKKILSQRCRYQSVRSADAFVVRPTGVPEGTLCFEFTWLREKKEMKVSVPTSGQEIGKIPGRWGPRTVFHKAGSEQIPMKQNLERR